MDVLIVEDEWLIAQELKDYLEDIGHTTLGPALSCDEAMEILRNVKPDVAILDSQLGSETCEPVFELCARLSIPVIISTGHDPSALPAFLKDCILIPKPHAPNALEKALDKAVARRADPTQ